MNGPSLATHGDPEEQNRWPEVRKHFPLYEAFWQVHVLTLRDGTGHVRQDIDERLELMAQAHYRCFISVSIALAGLADESHPERTFSSLQNAANQAQNVVETFNSVRRDCLPHAADVVGGERFADFARSIALYRNFIHEDVIGILQHQGQRYIPRPDRLSKYARWSRFRNADLADFVLLSNSTRQQFDSLCALLAEAWEQMLESSGDVFASTRYAQLLPPIQPDPAMQQVALCSNVQIG